jgi:hypothetical protein
MTRDAPEKGHTFIFNLMKILYVQPLPFQMQESFGFTHFQKRVIQLYLHIHRTACTSRKKKRKIKTI